jgi:hypothetical protein
VDHQRCHDTANPRRDRNNVGLDDGVIGFFLACGDERIDADPAKDQQQHCAQHQKPSLALH